MPSNKGHKKLSAIGFTRMKSLWLPSMKNTRQNAYRNKLGVSSIPASVVHWRHPTIKRLPRSTNWKEHNREDPRKFHNRCQKEGLAHLSHT